jgi:GTP diphosphokinase / guanosine-3',5'-bis(diphosphate) 3'-diphosphatase
MRLLKLMTEELIQKAKNNLLEKVKFSNPKADLNKIVRAIDFAKNAHVGQTRASGEPFIIHPIAVAEILTELKLDTASLVTAILHDVIEDTEVKVDEVEKEFGAEIAKLVDGVTKLTKIEYQPEHVKQAENFRKLLLAISEDIRVLLVKLSDRLHNMRTIEFIKNPQKRLKISYETMEIYAPLSERIGIHKFKNELQDIAFSEMHPEIRKSILNRLEFLRKEGGVSLVKTIEKEILETIKSNNINAIVEGREKTPCSIWKKMEHKNVAFEQLADIIAFRVIVDKPIDCYQALGAIHAEYHMIPGGFKDYISTPKSNGYQSLHTIVMGPEKRIIEVQIRTEEMHEVAELGVAAHWTYKQKHNGVEGTQFRWIRELLEILENTSNAEEFLENTKLEMYYDQVFCFTPKGDLIALPRCATPVDFAFAVHTDIGLTCIGCRINGRIVPLKTQLDNGDQVEILRSKSPMPSPTWEKFVLTGKARAEIRKFIRFKQREEYLNLGRAILNKTLQQAKKEINVKELTPILSHFKKESIDDLLVGIGEGVINRIEVFKALYPNEKIENKKSRNPLSLLRLKGRNVESTQLKSVPIKGLIPGMAIHFAGCCHPLPGDRIVGIINTGRGITIHTSDCEMLEDFSSTPERWVDVSWDGTGEERYVGRLKITISNETGSLATMTKAISMQNSNISNFKIIGRSLDFFEIIVDLEVKGVQQLTNLMMSLRSLYCIHSAERYKI